MDAIEVIRRDGAAGKFDDFSHGIGIRDCLVMAPAIQSWGGKAEDLGHFHLGKAFAFDEFKQGHASKITNSVIQSTIKITKSEKKDPSVFGTIPNAQFLGEKNCMSNKNINHEVGKIISQQRKTKGLTLKALGKLAGTTGPQIHRLENGGTQVTMEWLERIAAALGLKAQDLMPENQQANFAMAEYKAAIIGTIQVGVIQPQPFKYIGDIAYPGMLGSLHAPELFAMTMGDSSFSRIYPAGTILLCEPMKTAMQMLVGDHVITAQVTDGGTELGLAILLADSGGGYRLALQDSLREAAPHTANMILVPNTSFTPTRVKNGLENSLKAEVAAPFHRQVLGVVRQTIRPR